MFLSKGKVKGKACEVRGKVCELLLKELSYFTKFFLEYLSLPRYK